MGSRVAGTDQPYRPYLAPAYAATRFLPWSALAAAGACAAVWAAWVGRSGQTLAALPPRRRAEARRWRKLTPWVGYGAAVVGVLMLASTQRPDRLMPLYPAASLLTAAALLEARRRWAPPRWVALVVLTAVSLGGLVGVPAVLAFPPPGPGPLEPAGAFGLGPDRAVWWNLWLGVALAAVGGAAVLAALLRGRWVAASWAACFAVVGLIAVEGHYRAGPSLYREGDQLAALAQAAQSHRGGGPLVFHETGYAPIQEFFARNTPADDAGLDRLDPGGGLVITSRPGRVRQRFEGRVAALASTGELKEPGRALVLLRVGGSPVGGAAFDSGDGSPDNRVEGGVEGDAPPGS